MTAKDLALTLNIKDRTQPVTIRVPSTLTPKEIIDDLQAQDQVPKVPNRTVTMTHAKTNLQPDVPIGQQGVVDKDAVAIVWDGELAWGVR